MKDKKVNKMLNISSERKGKQKVWNSLLAILVCFVVLACIILPPSSGAVVPFLNKDGKKLANSISEKVSIEINGVGQGMFIKGKDIFFASLRCTDYTTMEQINIWRGKIFSAKTGLRGELDAFDAIIEVPVLDIPVYFFAGRYDYTSCYSLQREYYECLKVPVKGFYTFKESAHSPLFEEPKKAMSILYEDVLNEITILQDEK